MEPVRVDPRPGATAFIQGVGSLPRGCRQDVLGGVAGLVERRAGRVSQTDGEREMASGRRVARPCGPRRGWGEGNSSYNQFKCIWLQSLGCLRFLPGFCSHPPFACQLRAFVNFGFNL